MTVEGMIEHLQKFDPKCGIIFIMPKHYPDNTVLPQGVAQPVEVVGQGNIECRIAIIDEVDNKCVMTICPA